MNSIQFDNNNQVILKGVIKDLPVYSHTVMGEGFFEMYLEVQRLSKEVDVLPVTISERLIYDFYIGKEIGIIGQFRSYNKLTDGKSKLMLTIFAKEVVDASEVNEINHIYLTGFICKEPVYRTTPFGREICDVLIAVNRSYNKSDYLPCIAWGRNARFVKDLPIGEKLELQGRIQSRKYQKKTDTNNVETKIAYEISLSSIIHNFNEEDYTNGDGMEIEGLEYNRAENLNESTAS